MEDHRVRASHQIGIDLVRHHHVDDRFFLFRIGRIGKEFHIDPCIRINTVYVSYDLFQFVLRNIRRQFDIMARFLQIIIEILSNGHHLAERRQAVHRAAQLGDDFTE